MLCQSRRFHPGICDTRSNSISRREVNSVCGIVRLVYYENSKHSQVRIPHNKFRDHCHNIFTKVETGST